MASLENKIYLNRYRIIEEIGQGGMAIVYKVWDSTRMTYLAMKILREDYAMDKVFMRRFKREAQNLAQLKHPNIVRLYSIEQENLSAFMLLDYIDGMSLKKYIFTRGPLSSGEIKTILRALCGALHYAHNKGIIHCDIKPGNVMINSGGNVLLMDFGIARMTDAATATMVGAGTPAYMAPEQIMGRDPTVQTDIYSLGILLYEMFTGGERPFTGEQAVTGSTSEKVRWEQLHLDPPSVRKWNKNISVEMDGIIKMCLAKSPSDRYQTVIELLNAIETALRDAQYVPLSTYVQKEISLATGLINDENGNKDLKRTKKPVFIIGSILMTVFIFGIYIVNTQNPTNTVGSNQQSNNDRVTLSFPAHTETSDNNVITKRATPTLGKPTSTSRSSPTPVLPKPTKLGGKWDACLGADYRSRIQVNSKAFVSYDPPFNNNVRAKAGLGQDLIGKIAPGEKIQIIDGPKCADNWVWWKVRSLRTGLVGWTSEGDAEDYWLVPEGLSK